ncbi:hypothetical protein L873DRAFT_1842922 [Choiromyces venosus 120613-1]|uniref:Uncharacterized protein n=1 Tax=Choiromyces venosus 120613-1 TaxID=1336337 RepID=A0A3N4JR25_9PEZI|nr:hypothetical protein L873DRAFT_1842922 [Choiromyces venosus 120613-1]
MTPTNRIVAISLDYLSLSSEILKVWQSSGPGGARFQVDVEKLERSYTHSRNRVLLALKAAIQQKKSFGVRQEHKLSIQLFHSLKETAHQIVISQLPDCYYIQESLEIFHFIYGNFLRFGLGLEPKGIFREKTGSRERNLPSLGLKNQLATYKFCWLHPSVIDWTLHKAKHLLHQKTQWEILEKFEELLKEIDDPSSKKTYKILAFLGTLVIQKFRTDVWTTLFKFCDSEWKEDPELTKELALSGQLPLDHSNILDFSPSRLSRIKYSNKYKFSLQERWEILFHSGDR